MSTAATETLRGAEGRQVRSYVGRVLVLKSPVGQW